MPNHFHFLIKQKDYEGMIRFMSDISNSLTRFFNLLNNRHGPIFLPQFKSRRIVNREQLIHVSRYIHLNPYSSGILERVEDIGNYSLSSLGEYTEGYKGLCDTDVILNEFQGNRARYESFVTSNAEYQKTLEYCKHVEK